MNTLKISQTHISTGVDTIVYRELNNDNDFEQCINLQRSIFKLPDTHLVSPLFLKLYARNEPPSGISVGVFNTSNGQSNLLGFIIGSATLLDKSLYIVMLGIKQEYTNKVYGYKLLMKFRDIALSRNLEQAYGVFEPLETNLARLYINNKRFEGIKYIEESKKDVSSLSSDKLLVKWNLSPQSKISDSEQKITLNEAIKHFPIITNNFKPENNKVLLEIPQNFIHLKTENKNKAIELRNETSKIFNQYLNIRSYKITDCITGKINNQRKTYYLLEKK